MSQQQNETDKSIEYIINYHKKEIEYFQNKIRFHESELREIKNRQQK